MAWLPTQLGANTNPIYPVGTNTNLWPDGGSAASPTSIPAVASQSGSVSNDPNYWLPIWSGEVINAYDQYNMFEPMVTTETIESGTTKRFPITGTVGHLGVWNAGQELIGNSGTENPGWFDISLDQRPMAAFFELDDIHLMLTQWDYRAELARQAGLKLSYIRDKQIACMIAQGAFTVNRAPFTSDYSGMNASGNVVLAPNATFNALGFRGATATQRTDAALLLLDYLERYMVRLSEIDATLGEVYCAVTPQAFHDIRALGIARQAGDLAGGAGRPYFGGVAEAGGLGVALNTPKFAIQDTLEYMGVTIVKSNHLAELDHVTVKSGVATDITGNVSSFANINRSGLSTATATVGQLVAGNSTGAVVDLGDAKYDFNWHGWGSGGTNPAAAAVNDGRNVGDVVQNNVLNPVKALIWQRSAICSLRLQGMKVESVKDVRRGTYFTVSSIMAGAGILRPELCGAIQGTYTVA
jgi:hypothetical protein